MVREFAAGGPAFHDDRPPRWKRIGVVWLSLLLNFSLWGTALWALAVFG